MEKKLPATYIINPRERLTYLQYAILSSIFLPALQVVLCIMSDKVMFEAIHQFMGQKSPAKIPFTHRPYYIERIGKERKVGPYGDEVARFNLLGRN